MYKSDYMDHYIIILTKINITVLLFNEYRKINQ